MFMNNSSFVRLYFQKYKRLYPTNVGAALQKIPKNVRVTEQLIEPNKEIIDEIRSKILYNTVLEGLRSDYGTRKNFFENSKKKFENHLREVKRRYETPLPITLKYFTDDESILNELRERKDSTDEPNVQHSEQETRKFSLPYAREEKVEVNKEWMREFDQYRDEVILNEVRDEDVMKVEKKENNADIGEEYEKQSWKKNYGTPDPNAKVSDVQCGGCGANIHCNDPSIPGYLPSEIFKNSSPQELYRAGCQRCYFLKEYNLALGVTVRPEDYQEMLKVIQPQHALILLMIDLLDFPCSMWPDITNLVGKNKPVVVVGNKIDLIPQSSVGYLKHIEDVLRESVLESTGNKINIEHVSLISAKTGYGVEDLITKLYKVWSRGDVYIVGTTNVGKSTLFNSLLQSDFCKVQAEDLLHRATVSPWPGTTLNMLKFPISRPGGAAMYLRHLRLQQNLKDNKMEQQLQYQMIKNTGDPKYAMLVGKIERTIPNLTKAVNSADVFSYTMASGYKESGPTMGINEHSKKYAESKWCYDTPGVIQEEQIINLLTIEELMCTLPKELIRPRTFYLHQGYTLFLAGIGRVDVLKCERALRLNVFSSNRLPVTVCETKDADFIYTKLLNTDYFLVPKGNADRIDKWPGLKKHSKHIQMEGLGWACSSGDIVLSSGGWVSVNAPPNEIVRFAAWIVGGKGVHCRQPALIEKACQMKGERIMGTPAYKVGRLFINKKMLEE